MLELESVAWKVYFENAPYSRKNNLSLTSTVTGHLCGAHYSSPAIHGEFQLFSLLKPTNPFVSQTLRVSVETYPRV
jgi:hypothetical protein